MIPEEIKKEIIFSLKKKKIKKTYINYILKYIEINMKLFPFLDIDKLKNRILENFSNISLNLTSFLYNDYGQYIPTTGRILLSPKLFFGKNKKYKESVFLHELDHCACTPIELKQKYNEYKRNKKYKFLYKITPNFITSEIFIKIHYQGAFSGIADLERKKGNLIQKIAYGNKLQNYLNEGITSFKQKIYSETLNIKFHEKNDFFYGARIGVKCIADIIGLENMIYFHFNNNFEQIKQIFEKKTGIKIDDLILKCIIYDTRTSKRKLKELKDFVDKIHLKSKKNIENA